jgi:hypothetical protein
MSVIRIEENRVIEPPAQAGDHGGNLVRAQKATLTLRSADEDRRFQLARSFCHSLQCDEVGDIEVADPDLPMLSILQYLDEPHHVLTISLGMNAPQGHAVQIIQHDPAEAETSTDKIAAAIARIRGKSLPKPDEPDDPEPPKPN